MDNRIEKLKELMENEDFVREFLSKENPEDVQILLENNGVELTIDEIKQIGAMLDKIVKGEISQEQLEKAANGELSEDELEEVAGGSVILSFLALGLVTAVIAGGTVVGSYSLVKGIASGFTTW